MPTFLDYYRYGLLAHAAYVNTTVISTGSNAGEPTSSIQTFIERASADDNFPQDQDYVRQTLPTSLGISWFNPREPGLEKWTLLNQDAWDGAGSGFSATLFSDGTQKVLAIRGTEGGGPSDQQEKDLAQADIGDIGLKGLALHQAVDMVNYILRLTAEKTRTDVVQITLVENQSHRPDDLAIPYISTRSGYSWFRLDYNGQGLGLIVEPGEKIVVTGHSLGGHLAALATRLFPWLVSDAYTYNAPGFDPSTAEMLGLALQGLLNPLGAVILARTDQLTDEYISLLEQSGAIPTPASSFAAVAANIHAIVSEDIVPGDDTVRPTKVPYPLTRSGRLDNMSTRSASP